MKKVVYICLCCLSFFTLNACQSSEEKATAEPFSIGVLVYDENDPFQYSVAMDLKENLSKFATVKVEFGEFDQYIQDRQFDQMVKDDIDLIIVNVVAFNRAYTLMDKAKKNNIPVIFYNREPDLSILKNYDDMYFVGTHAAEAGIMQGTQIKDLWDAGKYDRNNDGIFEYVMIRGNLDSVEATERTINSVASAQKAGVKMNQIGETFVCNWEKSLAVDAMNTIMLTNENDIELVISNNDNMALGAIEVLQQFGYNKGADGKFIPVIGVDALPEAIEAIEKGSMYGTVRQNGVRMAETISLMAKNLLEDEEILKDSDLDWDASGVGVRIPYELVQ